MDDKQFHRQQDSGSYPTVDSDAPSPVDSFTNACLWPGMNSTSRSLLQPRFSHLYAGDPQNSEKPYMSMEICMQSTKLKEKELEKEPCGLPWYKHLLCFFYPDWFLEVYWNATGNKD